MPQKKQTSRTRMTVATLAMTAVCALGTSATIGVLRAQVSPPDVVFLTGRRIEVPANRLAFLFCTGEAAADIHMPSTTSKLQVYEFAGFEWVLSLLNMEPIFRGGRLLLINGQADASADDFTQFRGRTLYYLLSSHAFIYDCDAGSMDVPGTTGEGGDIGSSPDAPGPGTSPSNPPPQGGGPVECPTAACGPAPGMGNQLCNDGTLGGPTGRCIAQPSGQCGWEMRSCPETTGASSTKWCCPNNQDASACRSVARTVECGRSEVERTEQPSGFIQCPVAECPAGARAGCTYVFARSSDGCPSPCGRLECTGGTTGGTSSALSSAAISRDPSTPPIPSRSVRATKVNYTFTENIVPELPQTPSVNEDGSLIAFTLRSPSDAEFHPGRNICGVALERGTWSGIPCDFGFFRPVTPRRGSFLFLNSPLLLAMDYGSRLLVYNRGTDAFRTTPEQEPFMYVGVVLSPDKTSMLYRKSNGTLSAFNFATSAESDAQHLQSYWDTASDVLGDPQKVYSADFHFVAGYEKPTSVSAEPYILNTSTKEKTYPLQGTMYEGYSAIPLAVSSNGRYLFLEIPYTLQRTNPARVERRSFVVRMNLQTKEFIMLLNSDGSEDFASHGIGISDDGSTFAVLKQIGTSPLPTFAIGRFDGTTPPPAAPSSASARSSSSQDNFESICDINPSACQSSRSSSRMSSSAPSSRPPTPPGPIAANLCIALMRDPTISADGNTILFYGALRQVGDPDYMNWRETGFYIYDRQSTSLLTAVPRGNVINFMSAALAADGRSIAFIKGSDASWKDAVSGREIALAPQSVNPGISADGRFITYASYGSTTKGIWMYDRETQQRIQVYAALPNDDWMFYAPHRVSADGNIVAFMHGGSNQINIWNRSTGVTEQIAITVGNSNVELTSMDATGRYIAFVSNARNILNKDNMMDNSRPFTGVPDGFNAYVYDRETKKVQRYSIGVGGDQPGNDYMPVLSGDGRFLLYKSNRGTITQSLPNGTYRLFMQSVSSPYSATKIADVQPEATYRMDHDGSVVVFTGDYHLQVRENGIMTTLAPRKCE